MTLALVAFLALNQSVSVEITNTQSITIEATPAPTPEPSILDQYPDLEPTPVVEPDETQLT